MSKIRVLFSGTASKTVTRYVDRRKRCQRSSTDDRQAPIYHTERPPPCQSVSIVVGVMTQRRDQYLDIGIEMHRACKQWLNYSARGSGFL